MGEVLKVCRLGRDWAVKDRTGAFWGQTDKRSEAEATAAKMAKLREGCTIVIRDEQGTSR